MVYGAPAGDFDWLSRGTTRGVAMGESYHQVYAATAAGNRLPTLGRLPLLDRWRAAALSALQVVRRCESAAARLVAVIPLTVCNEQRARCALRRATMSALLQQARRICANLLNESTDERETS